MTAVDSIVRTLNERFADATRIVTPRANEVHCELSPVGINRLADLVCRDLGAELIAIAGDDRRREARVFFVHYVFADRAANWFVHASVRLNGGQPELPTMAPSHYAASRFERELRDLFGIDVLGHPDPRPLVKHAFWLEDYYPLRKDANAPSFADDGRPFPFTPVGGEGVYEIPVGPVHAGVIEPGHFRFSVMGETIIDMK